MILQSKMMILPLKIVILPLKTTTIFVTVREDQLGWVYRSVDGKLDYNKR